MAYRLTMNSFSLYAMSTSTPVDRQLLSLLSRPQQLLQVEARCGLSVNRPNALPRNIVSSEIFVTAKLSKDYI